MKILRSMNRRGDSIVPNGYFTVLKSNRWFAASRLPDSYHSLVGRLKGASPTPVPEEKAQFNADSQTTVKLTQLVKLGVQEHPLMRPALLVLAAIAITYFVLWWIMQI
jgi:RsiW-degrading membrane proteinase PrsW (M82 family)